MADDGSDFQEHEGTFSDDKKGSGTKSKTTRRLLYHFGGHFIKTTSSRYEPDYASIAAATQLYPTVGDRDHKMCMDSVSALLKQAVSPRYAEATLLSSRVVTWAVFIMSEWFCF